MRHTGGRGGRLLRTDPMLFAALTRWTLALTEWLARKRRRKRRMTRRPRSRLTRLALACCPQWTSRPRTTWCSRPRGRRPSSGMARASVGTAATAVTARGDFHWVVRERRLPGIRLHQRPPTVPLAPARAHRQRPQRTPTTPKPGPTVTTVTMMMVSFGRTMRQHRRRRPRQGTTLGAWEEERLPRRRHRPPIPLLAAGTTQQGPRPHPARVAPVASLH